MRVERGQGSFLLGGGEGGNGVFSKTKERKGTIFISPK